MQVFTNQVFVTKTAVNVYQWFGEQKLLKDKKMFSFVLEKDTPVKLVKVFKDSAIVTPIDYASEDIEKAVRNSGGKLEVKVSWSEITPKYLNFVRPIHKNSRIKQNVNFKITSVNKQRFDKIKNLHKIISPLGGYIAGSCAAYLVLNEQESKKTPGDIDIFVENETSFEKIKEKLLSEKALLINDNSLVATFIANSNIVDRSFFETIQLVKPNILANGKTFGTPEEIVDSFDFSVCRAIILNEDVALVDEDFSGDNTNKSINTKNLQCPIGSSIRLLKYTNKGFSANTQQHFLVFSCAKVVGDEDYNRLVDLFEKKRAYLNALESGEEIDINDFGLTEEEMDEMYFYIKID